MKINAEIIGKLNPCKNRFDNFKEQYPEFDGSLSDFVALDNITYSDKIWVAVRLLSKNQLVKWSLMCVESTKHIFNTKYPENKALDNLFDYMNSLSDFENLSEEQKNKLKELRYAAAAYAYAAAYAARNAAREEQNNLNLLFLVSLDEG